MGLPLQNSHSGRRRDQIISVDLGGCHTKAVHLQKKGGAWNLINFAVLDALPSDKTLDAGALTAHFKEIQTALGNPKCKHLVLSLGVESTFIRQIEMPMMPVEDLRQLLKLNTKSYLQQEFNDYVYDCVYLPPREVKSAPEGGAKGGASAQQKYKVLVTGASRILVETLQASARSAGFSLEDVVPGIISPGNAFEHVEPDAFNKEVVGLVDVGYKHSFILILDNGEPVLNRVVNVGSERITTGLAESLGITPNEAEGIKVGMPTEVQPALEAVLNPLGRELRASLDFFEHQYDKPITQVFLSGGSARNEVIVAALQNELMVPCRSWNPTRFLQVTVPPAKTTEIDETAPQLAVVLGAAATSF